MKRPHETAERAFSIFMCEMYISCHLTKSSNPRDNRVGKFACLGNLTESFFSPRRDKNVETNFEILKYWCTNTLLFLIFTIYI